MSSYHVVVARASVLKAPFIGVLSASPVACLLHGMPVPAFVPIVATATFVCGRELLMDVLDIAGDAATGSRTVAVRLGTSTGAGLGFSLVLAGAWLFHVSAGYALQDGGRWQGVLAAAVLGASLALWVSRPSRRRFVIYLMWIVLVSGIHSVLVLLQQARAR